MPGRRVVQGCCTVGKGDGLAARPSDRHVGIATLHHGMPARLEWRRAATSNNSMPARLQWRLAGLSALACPSRAQELVLSDSNVWFVRFALDRGGRTLACGNRAGAVMLWDPHELRARPRAKLKRAPGAKNTVRIPAVHFFFVFTPNPTKLLLGAALPNAPQPGCWCRPKMTHFSGCSFRVDQAQQPMRAGAPCAKGGWS